VTKAELLDAIWPGIAVSDVVPTVCVQELRKVLGDSVETPQFIETVPRRGYRFIAPLTATQPEISSQYPVSGGNRAEVSSAQLAPDNWQLTTQLIGREAELARLRRSFDKVIAGQRQIIFISGEIGIGKTALVEAFIKELTSTQEFSRSPSFTAGAWVGRGQCIGHHGGGEDFLPILDALRQLCRTPGHEQLITLLNRYAPTWLLQLPVPLGVAELEAVRRRVHNLPRERMLWEIAEALEGLAGVRPLVLWLEDLHWSDASTLELLSFLARRQEPARLLVIGTYRPVEILGTGHPLSAMKQELQLHNYCEEIRLPPLSEDHVATYLARRFASEPQESALLRRTAKTVHYYTEGNPLFFVSVANHLSEIWQGERVPLSAMALEETVRALPASFLPMIEQQLARLSIEEQRVLEVASVAGVEFAATAVAAGLEMDVVQVEEICGELARREQFLQMSGTSEWPDGSVSTRFLFQHALYREVIYRRLTGARRLRLHKRIGEREEASYGERTEEIALTLAMHFEHGRDLQRTVKYLRQAAEVAWRSGHTQEAERLLIKGLTLIKTWPGGEDRAKQESELHTFMESLAWNGSSPAGINGTNAFARLR
jgi:predicted ATPase